MRTMQINRLEFVAIIIIQESKHQKMQPFLQPFINSLSDNNTQYCKANLYDGIMWYRRIVITVSCACLLINMFVIIKTKQYVYNTLKLFLFVELFTFFGQICVLFHQAGINDGRICRKANEPIQPIIKNMIDSGWQNWACSIEAYVNLVCYNISYVFAVFITLYVRTVINNTHKKFMRRHLKVLAISIVIILVVFSVPFIFSMFQGMWYSFGPAGFQVLSDFFYSIKQTNKQTSEYYFFYCGIISRTQGISGRVLSVLNFVILPLTLFGIHLILIWRNSKSLKALRSLQQLNPRQWFLLKSGGLSIFLFFVQLINFIKYILTLPDSNEALIFTISMLNCIFDLFPIALVLFYYLKYYKKVRKFQKTSILRYQNESIVTNQVLSDYER